MARRTCRYSGTVREQIAAAFRRRLQFRDNRQGLDVAPAVLASHRSRCRDILRPRPGDAAPDSRGRSASPGLAPMFCCFSI
jgi:hypothetical protein